MRECVDFRCVAQAGTFVCPLLPLRVPRCHSNNIAHSWIRQHRPFFVQNMSDSTVGLEAQQRYSTGYIQCVHELHNLLLTCEWMDKTLGARLLNHLLKSLPRSKQETCTSALRPPTPVTPCCPPHHLQGSPVSCGAATPVPDQHFGGCDVSFARDVALENTELAPDYPLGPMQARRLFNTPGSLDMWRPW
ncbi:HES6 protein, partial [Polyodon spathula]|nr:HES6 protein [Polyodon spathula]